MFAVIATTCGGPEVLQYRDVPKPRITHPWDVLVRVRAAGVNPGDCQNRQFGAPQYASADGSSGFSILGMDGSGVIEEVGDAVENFARGDEVWYYDGGYSDRHGSYAEYKIVNGHYLAFKPRTLSFAAAAALPVVALTAWEAIVQRAAVHEGQFVLVHGAAGGVGHISVQLAASRGARVAATVSTPSKAEIARAYGAELCIDYRKDDVAATLNRWTGKNGADVVLDYVGHENFVNSFGLVAPYGTLVNAVVSDWPQGNNEFAEYNNLSIKFVNIGWPQVSNDHKGRLRQTRILREVAALVDEGKLRVHLHRTYRLDDLAEAHRALDAGEVIGRIVVEMEQEH